MAAAARDEARALALVDAVDPRRGGRSCDAETERRYVGPIQREVALAHGKKLAEKRDWAAAATMYETYLRTHEPDADVLESLAGAYLALFDHPHAADAWARLANVEHAAEPRRREAAVQALLLFTADGESEKARAEHRVLVGLHPTADERATADYRIAGLDGDAGMARFWDAHRADTTPSSRGLLVEAAHAAGHDRSWHSRTLAAWDALAAVDPARAQSVPFVDDGAEAAFALADADARATTDAWSKRPLPTTAADTFSRHRRDAEEAKRLDAKLRADVIDKMRSAAWVANAVARQGAIWDTLRTSLYDVTKVKTLDARGEALVASLKKSGQETRAGELEDTASEVWRARKAKELDAVEALLVARYATAVAHAQKHGVKSAEITHALSRLAYFTDLLGDAKMRAYVTSAGLPYDDHMYVTKQPGLAP